MRIFLLGFMGSGKSYWGKAIAEAYELPFFDLDVQIEEKEGRSIAQIFTQGGENSFRNCEAECLRSLIDNEENMILSTGGGTPCFYDNMSWMNAHGITIFLQAPPAYIVKNVSAEKNHRPLISDLTDIELLLFADRKMKERLPFYSQAHFTLNAETADIQSFREVLGKNT